jgi:plastocyanin
MTEPKGGLMNRRSGILAAAAFLAVLVLPVLPAGAGGGCHTGATQGTGDTVELADMCFTPSALSIRPGDSVTFVNTDAMVHNVGGTLWGHYDDLNPGASFTATFDQPGIYPYACNYHPGMTGAVIVGDGTGAGNGETVQVSSFEQPEPSPVVRVRTVTEPASPAPVAIGWVAGAVIGLAIGLGIAALVRRKTTAA